MTPLRSSSLFSISANRRSASSWSLQKGYNDRRSQRGQHGHRLEDLAHQGSRQRSGTESLGVHEAEGAQRG